MSEKSNSSGKKDRIDCEKMTSIEIEEWIVLTRKVLIILDDEDKNTYNKAYQDFLFDLQHLKNAGRITDVDYEEILENL